MPRLNISLSLDSDILNEIIRLSEEEGTSRSRVVNEALAKQFGIRPIVTKEDEKHKREKSLVKFYPGGLNADDFAD